MRRILASITVICFAASPAWAAAAKYSIKTGTNPIPKEVQEPIARLLSDQSVEFMGSTGKPQVELWFRKELPAKASPAQIKSGLTYRVLEETTLLGAIRILETTTDFRKQKIKAGVYTLRLGFQPMDGDHMGTAPYTEFGLLTPATLDAKPETMTAKELQEKSGKSAKGHPAVFLLIPNNKPAGLPTLLNKSGNWVLSVKEEVEAGGQKGTLGIGLTLIGHAE